MSAIYELIAFLEEEGERVPFYLQISEPQQEGAEDYYCRVHAPQLFAKDKDIFGVDAEQARSLAMRFVQTLLDDKRLVDENGKAIMVGDGKLRSE